MKMRKLRVLFLCTGNSCRSQMAEGFLRHLAGDRFDVVSAGTNPAGVNPITIAVMNEIGIDISKHRSKSVDEFTRQRFDYVITVCDSAKESCPYFAGGKILHWSIKDPAGECGSHDEILKVYKTARDDIRSRIIKWLESC